MNNYKQLFPLLTILLLLLVACSRASADHDAEPHGHDDEPGAGHIHAEAPTEFVSLINPYADDHEAAEAGELIFQTNCVTCHGAEGAGDGPAAASLNPKPASLADGMMMGTLSDGYLFWRVSKGGQMAPFNSTMPAWELALTEEQRWL
ncbi:MAG: cytochrome c [Anaerolinea sp.]|nr:cytochrome c [Anaerolinea sp.]